MAPYGVWARAAKRTGLELALVGVDGPVDVTGMHGLQFTVPAGDRIAGSLEYTRDRDVWAGH